MGIGTLVIFIAMVLIAVISAGVLFQTAGIFEQQTEQTSDEASSQLTDQLEVIAITGNNITDTSPYEINRIKVIVTSSAGGGAIDLRNVSVQWLDDDDAYTLLHEEITDNTNNFSTEQFADIDGTFPVLTSDEDRYGLVFEPGVRFGGSGVREGERVELTLATPSGATKAVSFKAPDTLDSKNSVEL